MVNHLTKREFTLWVLLVSLGMVCLFVPSIWIAGCSGLFLWLSVYTSAPKPQAPDEKMAVRFFCFLAAAVACAAFSLHMARYVAEPAHANMKHLLQKRSVFFILWPIMVCFRYCEWRKTNTEPAGTDAAALT